MVIRLGSLILISILFVGTVGLAAPNKPKQGEVQGETWKDLIQKARNLSLQKDRLQATKILARALDKETSSNARNQLVRALTELAEMFYTEKGQQLFEFGESLRIAQPKAAVERFIEATKEEPGNFAILKSLGRTQLSLGNCEDSYERAEEALGVFPDAEDFLLLKAQSQVCLFKTEESRKTLKKLEGRKGPLLMYVELVRGQGHIFDEKLALAKEPIKKAIEMDKNYPEGWYWLSQLRKKEGGDFVEPARKYIQLCSAMSEKSRRNYSYEPRVCVEKVNMETMIEEKLKQKGGG